MAKANTYFFRGNAITPHQYSNYIRPFRLTLNPVGETVSPGHLREFDLKSFRELSLEIRSWLDKHADEQVILYKIRGRRGENERIYGWFITADHQQGYKLLLTVLARNSTAARQLVEAAVEVATTRG